MTPQGWPLEDTLTFRRDAGVTADLKQVNNSDAVIYNLFISVCSVVVLWEYRSVCEQLISGLIQMTWNVFQSKQSQRISAIPAQLLTVNTLGKKHLLAPCLRLHFINRLTWDKYFSRVVYLTNLQPYYIQRYYIPRVLIFSSLHS